MMNQPIVIIALTKVKLQMQPCKTIAHHVPVICMKNKKYKYNENDYLINHNYLGPLVDIPPMRESLESIWVESIIRTIYVFG